MANIGFHNCFNSGLFPQLGPYRAFAFSLILIWTLEICVVKVLVETGPVDVCGDEFTGLST